MKKSFVKALTFSALAAVATSTSNAAAILVTTPLVVKFTDDVNPAVGSSSTLAGEGTAFGWNVDGFGGNEFTFTTSLNHNLSFDRIFMDAPGTTTINKGGNFPTRQLTNVAFGSTVDGSPAISFSTDTNTGNIINRANGGTGLNILGSVVGFTANNAGYIAFSFLGQSGGTQYGWAEITFNDGVNGGMTISQWGYETVANTPINVGDGTPVPEPSTFAMGFGLVALGVALVRRRRS